MESNLDMVNAVMGGDKESFMAAFNATLANKVSDALEVKKVELASNLLTSVITSSPVALSTTETTTSNEPKLCERSKYFELSDLISTEIFLS